MGVEEMRLHTFEQCPIMQWCRARKSAMVESASGRGHVPHCSGTAIRTREVLSSSPVSSLDQLVSRVLSARKNGSE